MDGDDGDGDGDGHLCQQSLSTAMGLQTMEKNVCEHLEHLVCVMLRDSEH